MPPTSGHATRTTALLKSFDRVTPQSTVLLRYAGQLWDMLIMRRCLSGPSTSERVEDSFGRKGRGHRALAHLALESGNQPLH